MFQENNLKSQVCEIPKEFKMLEANYFKPHSMYSIKLSCFLYGLKQFGCMWYNCLRKYLLKEGCMNNLICLFIFIKRSETRFVIIVMYVDKFKKLIKTANYLKGEFKLKDLRKTKSILPCRSSIFQIEC